MLLCVIHCVSVLSEVKIKKNTTYSVVCSVRPEMFPIEQRQLTASLHSNFVHETFWDFPISENNWSISAFNSYWDQSSIAFCVVDWLCREHMEVKYSLTGNNQMVMWLLDWILVVGTWRLLLLVIPFHSFRSSSYCCRNATWVWNLRCTLPCYRPGASIAVGHSWQVAELRAGMLDTTIKRAML